MKRKEILKEVGYGVLQFFFSRINLFGFISPAGLPFAFVRLFNGGNLFVVLISFFLSKIYLFSNLSLLSVTIYEIVIITLYYFALEFFKQGKKVLFMYGFLILSNALSLYFNIFNLTNLWHFLVNFLLQNLLLLYFYELFKIYKNKFIFFKFSQFDYAIFSILLLLLSIGIFEYNFILKYFGLFFISTLIVLLCRVLPIEKYFILTSVFSLGMVIVSKNYFFLVFSALLSLIFFQIKNLNKYFFSLVSLAIFASFALIFKTFDVISLISLAAALVLTFLIPSKFYSKLRLLFDMEKSEILSRQLEALKSKEIQQKLFLMSETLDSMQNNFKFLLVGKIDRAKASSELAGDIVFKLCNQCEFYKTCFLENLNKKSLIENLLFKAIEKTKINESDLMNGSVAYCSKSQILLNEINQTANLFLSYEKKVKGEDSSKLLIASEIQNFSSIFLNFAKMIENSSKINQKQSNLLKEALFNNLIDAKEVAIEENEFGIKSVNLILSNEQAMKREVIETIFKVTKVKTKLESVKHLEFSGICLAKFTPACKVKLEFAVSTKSKEQKNGDNAMVTKLDENKFFVAIADGMGHGNEAGRLSGMVLSLICSLFQIGLDEELIINSVNKLLLPLGLENFTTLDACVIDLDKMICNFIKLGSSVSVLKHSNTSELVSCASLPIGIIQNVKPTIVTKPVSIGDIIFLASDGVVDSFQNLEIYKSFINDAKIFNLQKYLDEVVSDATFQNKGQIDDMTIIGINLLKN